MDAKQLTLLPEINENRRALRGGCSKQYEQGRFIYPFNKVHFCEHYYST